MSRSIKFLVIFSLILGLVLILTSLLLGFYLKETNFYFLSLGEIILVGVISLIYYKLQSKQRDISITTTTQSHLDSLIKLLKEASLGKFQQALKLDQKENKQELEGAFNSMLSFIIGILSSLEDQNKILTEVKNFINKFNEAINEQVSQTEEIAHQVDQMATQSQEDAESIYNSMQDMSTATTEIAESVAKTAQMSAETQEEALITQSKIQKLSESSKNIGEVIAVIKNIASQTIRI